MGSLGMIPAAPAARLRGMSHGTLTVIVEIPKGSRNKYEMDHETGEIWLDRMLFTSMQYPADYGFIEGTLGGDGDPLDALVFVGEPTFPSCRIKVAPDRALPHDRREGRGREDPVRPAPRSDVVAYRRPGRPCRCPCSTRSSTSSRCTRTWKVTRCPPTGSKTGRRPNASSPKRERAPTPHTCERSRAGRVVLVCTFVTRFSPTVPSTWRRSSAVVTCCIPGWTSRLRPDELFDGMVRLGRPRRPAAALRVPERGRRVGRHLQPVADLLRAVPQRLPRLLRLHPARRDGVDA